MPPFLKKKSICITRGLLADTAFSNEPSETHCLSQGAVKPGNENQVYSFMDKLPDI